MKYRIKMDLSFPDEATLTDLENARALIAPLFQASVVVNEGEDFEERGFVELEKCFHDETPIKPCVILERWETGRGKVIG